MSDDKHIDIHGLEDLPNPSVSGVQQRELTEFPAVLVQLNGPAGVRVLPARRSSIEPLTLSTSAQEVVVADEKRARVHLICDQDFLISRTGSGQFAPWYAKVPLELQHCDSIWAKVTSGNATLSIITEIWAD